MFITQITTCQACGALWPQFGNDPRRVQTWKWVCSPACSIHYLTKAAGPIEDSGVPVTPAHIGTVVNNIDDPGAVPLSLDTAGALPPETAGALRHDYREQIERAVDSFSLNDYRGS